MKTHLEIAHVLRYTTAKRQLSRSRLCHDAGVSQRTLTRVLSGNEDFKLSTLIALADEIGLELLLLPKDVATAVSVGLNFAVTPPSVKSRVQDALDKIHAKRKP